MVGDQFRSRDSLDTVTSLAHPFRSPLCATLKKEKKEEGRERERQIEKGKKNNPVTILSLSKRKLIEASAHYREKNETKGVGGCSRLLGRSTSLEYYFWYSCIPLLSNETRAAEVARGK